MIRLFCWSAIVSSNLCCILLSPVLFCLLLATKFWILLLVPTRPHKKMRYLVNNTPDVIWPWDQWSHMGQSFFFRKNYYCHVVAILEKGPEKYVHVPFSRTETLPSCYAFLVRTGWLMILMACMQTLANLTWLNIFYIGALGKVSCVELQALLLQAPQLHWRKSYLSLD